MGPYEVVILFENGTVEIKTIDGKNLVFLVNMHRLKVYFQPLAKEDFMQQQLDLIFSLKKKKQNKTKNDKN